MRPPNVTFGNSSAVGRLVLIVLRGAPINIWVSISGLHGKEGWLQFLDGRTVRRFALCGILVAMAFASRSLAEGSSAGAAGDLRQIQQTLAEIRSECRARHWNDIAGMLQKIKRTFAHSTPQLLTRVSPEDLGHFSYALASLEDGVISKDPEQLTQGFRLSRVAMGELQNRFPSDLATEIQDLRQTLQSAASASQKGEYVDAADYLEDLAAARKRLDNAGMAYAKEAWVHFGLVAEDLARAVRAHNAPGAQTAASGARRDLDDLLDRIPSP